MRGHCVAQTRGATAAALFRSAAHFLDPHIPVLSWWRKHALVTFLSERLLEQKKKGWPSSQSKTPPSTWRLQSKRIGGRGKSSLPQKVLFCLGPLSPPSSKMHENTTRVFLHLWGWREWLLQKKAQREWENSKVRSFSVQLTRGKQDAATRTRKYS